MASRFPPSVAVGAIRVRKFVKYLCEFGWKPVVISGATPRDETCDEDGLLDLPEGLPVHRLSAEIDHWPDHASRTYGGRAAALTSRFGVDAQRWENGLRWRFQKLHDRFSFPDRGIWRLMSAVRLGLRLHRRYRFDAVFSSGMPFSDHLIGLVLRRALRKPWLADFRDPWAEYIHWPQWRTGWGRRLTFASEAAVIRNASFVVGVNESMTRRFTSRYPNAGARKFVTISNGFDPTDFKDLAEPRPRSEASRFRMVYVGSLYGMRSPEKVLAAFRQFIRTVAGSRERARFEFIGRPGPYVDKLTDPQDGDTVRHCGMAPYREALRAMASADLNVVILPNIPGGEHDTTTKIYECIGSGRPILAAVPPEGAAARVLRPFDGVSLCDPDDVAGMTAAISEWYRRWLAGTTHVSRAIKLLSPLTRRQQAKKLAACLDSTVRGNGAFGETIS